MNYSSAKDIYRVFKTSGRIEKFVHKKKRILEKISSNYFQQCIELTAMLKCYNNIYNEIIQPKDMNANLENERSILFYFQ